MLRVDNTGGRVLEELRKAANPKKHVSPGPEACGAGVPFLLGGRRGAADASAAACGGGCGGAPARRE